MKPAIGMTALFLSLCFLSATTSAKDTTASPKTSPKGTTKTLKKVSLWDGFPEGSWIIVEETEIAGKKTEKKRYKIALVNDDGKLIKRRYTEKDGKFPEKNSRQWHGESESGVAPLQLPGMKFVKSSTGTVKIKNVSYVCDVKEYLRSNPTEKSKVVLRLWHCKTAQSLKSLVRTIDLPGQNLALSDDVVKVEIKNEDPRSKTSIVFHVISFKAPQKIGKQTISCVHEEISMTFLEKGNSIKRTAHQWLSKLVPGSIVKQQSEYYKNKQLYKGTKKVTEYYVPASK